MTITVTNLGPNTNQITTAGPSTTFASLYTKIKQTVTAAGTGWTLVDDFLGNGAFTTIGTTVTAGNFIVGQQYTIATAGTTTFNTIGAANNTVGTTFTATAAGSGTGTATTYTCGFTVNDGSFIVGQQYTVSSLGTGTNWSAVGAANAVVGTIFTATATGSSTPGTGTALTSVAYDGTSYTDGQFIIGGSYVITSVGTTDFTKLGATANALGLQFTATAAGSSTPGTGTASFSADSFGTTRTLVLSSLNIDTLTSKYIIIRFNIVEGEINTSTCESWNAITHTAINECWTFHDCAPINFKVDATDLVFFVHPRYFIIHSYISNLSTLWSGVVETAREDSVDTPQNGFPCWGWISSTLWALGSTWPASGSATTGTPLGGAAYSQPLICYPRLANQNTGIAAAQGYASDYGATSYPTWLQPTAPPFTWHQGSAGGNKFAANGWDPSKRTMLPLKPLYNYGGQIINYGQAQAIKLLVPAGDNMTKIKCPIDVNGDYSASGTLSDHYLLDTHHRSILSTDNVSWFPSNWSKVISTINTGESPKDIVIIGGSYYMVTTAGNVIQYFLSGGHSNAISGSQYTYNRMAYDGEQYVYVGTNTGLLRINTVTNSTAFLALPNGCACPIVTGTHIVCTPAISSVAATPYRVLRGNFTLDTAASSFTTTPALAQPVIWHGTSDSVGNTYFVYCNTSATAMASHKVFKMLPNGTNAYISLSSTTSTDSIHWASAADSVSVTNESVFIKALDPNHILAGFTAATGTVALVNLPLFSVVSTQAVTATATDTVNNADTSSKVVKVGGVLLWVVSNTQATATSSSVFVINQANATNTITISPIANSISTYNGGSGTFGINTNVSKLAVAYNGSTLLVSTANGFVSWSGINAQSVHGSDTLGQLGLPA